MMQPLIRADLEDACILKNIAKQMRDLSEEIAQIAVTVSNVTVNMAQPPSISVIQNLQKIDEVQQSISDLAQLTHALACPIPVREAAFQNLKLGTTRALLQKGDEQSPIGAGAVDLF